MIAPTLVVEDGTGLPDSNTYIAVADAISYATAMGVTLPDGDGGAQITTWLLNAMVWLENMVYIGQQLQPAIWQNGAVVPGQALQWPRVDPQQQALAQTAPGALMPWMFEILAIIPSGVPTNIENAQAQLVVEQCNGIVLFQSQQGGTGLVSSERFDVLSTSYDVRAISRRPMLPIVDAFLRSLLVPGGACIMKTVRR